MASKSARRRLLAANRDLSLKEKQIRELLELSFQPGLSLLDETSATYLTCEEREALEQEEREARDTGRR